MKELKIRLMERMLGAELTAHLGYEAGAEPPAEQTNRRNGTATKRVKGSDGEVPLAVPRDREGSFEPELVSEATNATGPREWPNGQTRIDGVDDRSEPASRHRFETAGERALRRRAAGRATSRPILRIFTRSGTGNTGRWIGCIPLSSLTLCA